MNIEVAPISENYMTYDEAVMYCTFCRHDGHNDWRMPTKEEYKTYIESWCWNGTPSIPGVYGLINRLPVTPVRDIW